MVDGKKVRNMYEVLKELEKQSGHEVIIKYMVGTEVVEITGTHFFADIRAHSRALLKRGLLGKHVGLIGGNHYEWMVSFCAIFQAGAVAVPLNRELSPEEIADSAEQVDLDAILYDREAEQAVWDAELPETLQRIPMTETADEWEPGIEESVESGPEELCCIFFTSGTTARQKAVMLSQRAMITGVCCQMIVEGVQALLAVLPFHHLAGFNPALNALCLGKILCFADDLKYLYRYLEGMKPDYVLTVPSMLQSIARKLKKAGPNGCTLGWNLRVLACGGAKFQPEIGRILMEKNVKVLQSYGASEAGGLGFSWEMTPERPNTIGKPWGGLEAKIVDGELFLRSDSVMMGYYKDEEATREVLVDGWYATGDLCYQDRDGYFYLTGRKKLLIILSNGENVSPEEIETRLRACPDVREVLVGVEQNLIAATVFPNCPAGCTERERREIKRRIEQAVQQYNDRVPVYKQVQTLHFTEQPFAKTAMGKMIRRSVMTGGKPQ